MDSTFGTRLRLQREEQQIPLATIAEQTKIKLSLLEGLERDDVSRWPTGIFRRSYFRAYARAIGLEPDRVLREFQALYPDPDTERRRHASAGAGAADERSPAAPADQTSMPDRFGRERLPGASSPAELQERAVGSREGHQDRQVPPSAQRRVARRSAACRRLRQQSRTQ